MKQRTPKEEADRKTRVRELRGKYAFTKNSSDDFARRKAEEIESEENDGGDRKK
ncbi:MAG TPA: hypothetical protein VFD13_05710 [Candidatus Kapabacteria bacterium]|nr:hypothetical protein [Candidatus Kapabacteria bacterium]